WGKPILAEAEQGTWLKRLGETKKFLESIRPYNTTGKLKNFPYDVAAIARQADGLDLVQDVEELVRLIEQLRPLTGYLETADAVLPSGHVWIKEVKEARHELFGKLMSEERGDSSVRRTLVQRLTELKERYRDAYLDLHGKARLGAGDDKRKEALNTDRRLRQLQRLASVEGMPKQQLMEFQDRLLGLRTCFALTKQDLENAPTCPHCGFRPTEEHVPTPSASAALEELDIRLDEMVDSWTRALLADLEDPTVAASIDL